MHDPVTGACQRAMDEARRYRDSLTLVRRQPGHEAYYQHIAPVAAPAADKKPVGDERAGRNV